MTWLIPGLTATTTLTLLIGLIFIYLWHEEKEKYLLLWAISWCAYSLRFITHLLIIQNILPHAGIIFQNSVTVISGLFIIWGTYVFQEKRLNVIWLYASGLAILWEFVAEIGRLPFLLADLPNSLFVGWMYAWTGQMMLRFRKISGIGTRIAGWSLIFWGIHKADYTFLRPVAWFAPWGFLIASLLYLLSAIGVILSYYEKVKKELKDEIQARDLTEKSLEKSMRARQEVMEALSASEKKFRGLFENLYDIYYQTDAEGIVSLISPSVERVLGYSPKELIGRPLKDLYVNPTEKEVLLKQLVKDGHVTNFISSFKARNSTVIWLSANARIMIGQNGNILGEDGIIRDVTALKQVEEEKKKLETQLAQLQKMESIGTLAGGIAHDFNNILSPLIGFAELLKDDLPPENTLQGYIDQILHASYRARDLVKQILTFSRKGDQNVQPVQIQAVAAEALKLLRSSIPTTIDVQAQLDWDCGRILADPTQIHQIIMNIGTNAYHAMEETGGTLSVSLKEVAQGPEENPHAAYMAPPGKFALLTISDTGGGIDQAILDKIFEPYFTTKGIGKGTGLGLSVVRGIVHAYKGAIRIETQKGIGTHVHVYLPIVEPATETLQIEDVSPIPGGREKILLVDDEQAIVLLEQKMLEKLGYQVTVCEGSLEALAVFKAAPSAFDLVITDMAMPGLTGVQLTRELLSIRSDIPVILCTGFSDRINENTANALGIKGFIMKPMLKRDIAEMVRRVLDGLIQ